MCPQSRKELRNSESTWRGMSSSHRRHTKPYVHGTKEGNVLPIIKWVAIVIFLVIIGSVLYDMRQDCIKEFGDGIMCID